MVVPAEAKTAPPAVAPGVVAELLAPPPEPPAARNEASKPVIVELPPAVPFAPVVPDV